MDQNVAKEELLNCTRTVDEEFLEIVTSFMDNGNKIYFPNDEEFGIKLTERITNTGSSYSNCFTTKNRFTDNTDEWRLSSIFSIVHICLPLLAAAILWCIIVRRQQVIGENNKKHDVPSCMWFTWNLPWLPFTKFYEAGMHIRSLYLEYTREVGDEYWEKKYKANKAELAVMKEQNANTGKFCL